MAVSVVSFSFSLVAQPDPGVNSSVCWLSLLHRVSFRLPLYCLPSFSPISHCPQFVGLILPSNSHAVIYTRLNAYATSSDFQRPGCVTSFRCTTLNGIFGKVKRSKHNNPSLIIFQNSTCGIFFTFLSITLTHILQNNLQGQ